MNLSLFWVFSDMQWHYVNIEIIPGRNLEGYEGQVAQWPELQQYGAESSGAGSIRLALIAAPHSGSCGAKVTFVPGPQHFTTDPDNAIQNTASWVRIWIRRRLLYYRSTIFNNFNIFFLYRLLLILTSTCLNVCLCLFTRHVHIA